MLPVLIGLGAVVAATVGICYSVEKRGQKLQKELDAEIKRLGGMSKLNAIQLVSANYKGKIKVYGYGKSLSVSGYDWTDCDFEMRLAALRSGCEVVLQYYKTGSKKEGFTASGLGYRKA